MCNCFFTTFGCWSVVSIQKFVHKLLKECPLYCTTVTGSGKVGPINDTNLVVFLTQTDRPELVGSFCVIERFRESYWYN